MKSQVLHTVWCNISGVGEILNWSLLGAKGLTYWIWSVIQLSIHSSSIHPSIRLSIHSLTQSSILSFSISFLIHSHLCFFIDPFVHSSINSTKPLLHSLLFVVVAPPRFRSPSGRFWFPPPPTWLWTGYCSGENGAGPRTRGRPHSRATVTTLHYTTLLFTSLHCTTPHHTTPHHTTLHYTKLNCTKLNCTTLH